MDRDEAPGEDVATTASRDAKGVDPPAPPPARLEWARPVRLEPPVDRILRVVLVGFMGAGKSAVGRRLARFLNWRFADMDREIVAREERSVARIFQEEGEAFFREVEHRTALSLLGEEHMVISTGGGWPCREDRLESLDQMTLAVWLVVSAEAAVERISASRTRRPLLEVADPLARARALLEVREPYYALAHWHIRTEGRSSSSIAREIAGRIGGGSPA
ncbi:MAG: shikimate kinase [Gemmatimonadales bacterium]|nr:MAG: shikimate kinase [Gemmatimonadales bacterium]